MSDLIDRDALKKAVGKVYGCDWDYIEKYFHIAEAVNSLPSAETKRKKGKWVNASMNTYELSYGTIAYEPVYRCSACGGVTESYLRFDEPIIPEDADFPNFCPHCGADMREK